jgi:ATP-dependent DNA ligase
MPTTRQHPWPGSAARASEKSPVEIPMLYSEHMTEDGPAMFNAAARLNWECIISKRADAPYSA